MIISPVVVAAIFCLAVTLAFIIMYGMWRWFTDPIGWSIMATAASFGGLAAGVLVRVWIEPAWADPVLAAAFMLSGITTIWHIGLMWRVNHPAEAARKAAVRKLKEDPIGYDERDVEEGDRGGQR